MLTARGRGGGGAEARTNPGRSEERPPLHPPWAQGVGCGRAASEQSGLREMGPGCPSGAGCALGPQTLTRGDPAE